MKELSLQNSRLDKRYDVHELLGRGSYAEIYVARDILAAPHSPHAKVVIKALNVFMQNDLDADLERTLVENFQNEAIALDRVRHPNIISRLGHGTARDLRGTVFHYLVLEYLSGGDLAQATRRGSVSFEQAFDYLEQICAGLSHAHANGVIHRDIKPQNVLLTKDLKTAKIADFGVARFSASDSPVTRVGTNLYAPPEHNPLAAAQAARDAKELTPAADIYSLAKTAYVLLTGESPRPYANHQITALPADCRREPWAEEFLRVVGKATEDDPAARHQTVTEFWQDLSAVRTAHSAEAEMPTHVRTRPHEVPKAHVTKGYTPLAPQRPKFSTWEKLDLRGEPAPGANPSLVVQIDNPPARRNRPPLVEMQPKYPTEPEPAPPVKRPAPKKAPKQRRRALVLLAGLLVFLALLFGTHTLLRNAGIFPDLGFGFSRPVGVATSDVNLRAEGSADSAKIGLVPRNSRVRIVNSKDNWYEVDIIEFGRPKENPTDADHGWVNKRYINAD